MARAWCAVPYLLAAVTVVPAAALAQERPASTVEEIIVTAQKRQERLVDVPIAITAITAEKLAASGVTTTQELGQVVPGLRLDLAGGTSQPTIRGIGSALAGPGVGSAVAVYIDGIYQPNPLANNFELADIESVQVLKGPQGTLFGRNATGGAIVVTTRKPTFEPRAHGVFSYGRYNDVRAVATASGGITDNLAVSISALYHANDGFVRDATTGADEAKTYSHTLRGQLLFRPTDSLEFLLAASHLYHRDDNATTFSAYQGRTAGQAFPGTLIPTRRGEVSLDGPHTYHVRQSAISLKSSLDLDFATLTSYSGYQTTEAIHGLDFDATKAPVLASVFRSTGKAFSQELDLISKGEGPLTWVTGLYYFHDLSRQPYYKANGFGVVPTAPDVVVNIFSARVKTAAYAGFADATYEVAKGLFITAGARYSVEDSDKLYVSLPPSPGFPGSARFESFTPRAVVRYNFEGDSNVYASFSKGFKSGGFNPTSTTSQPFRPEKVTAYEAGFKTARTRWRGDASVFYYDYKDLQVSTYDLGVAIINNAASSRIYGGEVQVSADLTDRLSVDVGAAYTNSKYKSFANAPVYLGTGSATDPIVIQTRDISGQVMQRTPKFTATVSGTYNQPIGAGNLRLFASYYRTSKFNMDPAGQFPQKGYGLLSARATYYAPRDRFSIGVFGNNLTDSTYLTQILPFGGAILQQFGFPRTYGIEAGFKF